MTQIGNEESKIGRLARRLRERDIWIYAGAIIVSIGAPLLIDLPQLVTAGLQVAAAIFGAKLGSLFQIDKTATLIGTHARTSIRHIVDIMNDLGGVIESTQHCREYIISSPGADKRFVYAKTEGVLDGMESRLRSILNSSNTAMDNWGELDSNAIPDVLDEYTARDKRLANRWKEIKDEQSD